MASCSALGRSGSASQPASACSSDSVSCVGSTKAAAPSADASATPVSDAGAAAPGAGDGDADAAAVGVLVEPGRQLAGAEPDAGDVEALVGLGLDRLQRRVQPLAQHPELQGVEELVDLVAVPLAELQVVRTDVQRDVALELGQPAVGQDLDRWSRSASPVLPLTSSTRSTSGVERAELADPLGRGLLPTPGMPGRLSLGSPRSAA